MKVLYKDEIIKALQEDNLMELELLFMEAIFKAINYLKCQGPVSIKMNYLIKGFDGEKELSNDYYLLGKKLREDYLKYYLELC